MSAFRLARADAAIRLVVGLNELLRIAREAFVAMEPCVRTEFFAMLIVLCWRLTTIPPSGIHSYRCLLTAPGAAL